MNSLKIQIFNFDDPIQWGRVLSVIDDPLPHRALEAAMRWRCKDTPSGWDHECGPWEFSRRDHQNWVNLVKIAPRPRTPNWYRMFGYCGLMAHWSGAIGKLLFTDHKWYYAYNPSVPKFGCHCAGLGWKDKKRKSLIVMDLLFSPQCLREGTGNWLANLLTNENSKHVPIVKAIERLESDDCKFAGT